MDITIKLAQCRLTGCAVSVFGSVVSFIFYSPIIIV